MSTRRVKSDGAVIRFGIAAGRASGQVSLCKIKSMPGCALELTGLYVDPSARGRGWGHLLMDQACRYADEKKIDLVLRIHPFGRNRQRLDERGLSKLYAQHGFGAADVNRWDMVRIRSIERMKVEA